MIDDDEQRPGSAVHKLLPTRGTCAAAVAYAVVSIVFLVLVAPFDLVRILVEWQSALPSIQATRVLQSAMMPLLTLAVLLATAPRLLPGNAERRSRLVVLVLAGLGLSWLGDMLPGVVGPDAGFTVMIGFFLLAQVLYVLAFRQFASQAPTRRVPVVSAYVVVGVGIVAACTPAVLQGPPATWWLVPALVVYCGAIVTMAVLAWGVHRIAGIGGILFVISDGLIALMNFTDLPVWLPGLAAWSDVLIMSTYIAAQAFLAAGVLRREFRVGGQVG